jgi:hypothetical protein
MLNLFFRQDIPDFTGAHTLIHSFRGIVSAQFFVLTSTKAIRWDGRSLMMSQLGGFRLL